MLPEQLSFDDLHLRVIAADVPGSLPPVMRWRKMLRRVTAPPDTCSTSSFRAVGTVLADYADRNGRSCFPSVATIAADASLSERTVQYALAALEQRRLIHRQARSRSTSYTLLVPAPVEKPVEKLGTTAACGAGNDARGVQQLHPRSASRGPAP